MNETQDQQAPQIEEQATQTAEEMTQKVQEAINKMSAALEGTSMDVAFAALLDLTCGVITGPFYTNETKRAGGMLLLASASQVASMVGLTDEDIAEAMNTGKASG